MPTCQPTPGPSNPPSLKRSASSDTEESIPDLRDVKKSRKDSSIHANSTQALNGTSSASSKDKKKRKKKKRKISVVVVDAAPVHRATSRSRSVLTPALSVTPVATMMVVEQASEPTDIVVDSDSDSDGQDNKASSHSFSDKGKRKAKSPSRSPSVPLAPARQPTPTRTEQELTSLLIASTSSEPSTSAQAEAQAAEIARLTERLAAQTTLLERHQDQLTSIQHSLTCQICLDLLHKPFALAPCGHITCYNCLVRWFTTNPNNPRDAPVLNAEEIVNPTANPDQNPTADEGNNDTNRNANAQRAATRRFIHRRKTCPLCRALVLERPVEVFGVKSMVASLVRSGLAELPAPLESPSDATGANANADPWNNIFPPARPSHGNTRGWNDLLFDMQPLIAPPRRPRANPQAGQAGQGQAAAEGDAGANQNDLGFYDAEDGGIYRCWDCMHEIWGQVCSHCGRRYPAHEEEPEDDLGEFETLWDGEDGEGDAMELDARDAARRRRRQAAGVFGHFLQALAEGEMHDGPELHLTDDEDEEDGAYLHEWWRNTLGQPDFDEESDDEFEPPLGHQDFPVVHTDEEEDEEPEHMYAGTDPPAHIIRHTNTPDPERELVHQAIARSIARARQAADADGFVHGHEEMGEEEEEEEEAEESNYEGSFIDDDEVIGDHDDDDNVDVEVFGPHNPQPRHIRVTESAEYEDEDEDDDDDDEDSIARTFARLRETRNRPLPVPAPSSHLRSRTDHQSVAMLSDEENDSEDDSDALVALPRRRPTHRRAQTATRGANLRQVLSEEEDENDSAGEVIELFDSEGEEEGPTIRRQRAAAAAERRRGGA